MVDNMFFLDSKDVGMGGMPLLPKNIYYFYWVEEISSSGEGMMWYVGRPLWHHTIEQRLTI